jgi:hypothetical protein
VVLAVVVNDSDLRVGLFGLVGTLVGALATFEGTQFTARRDIEARRRAAGRLLQEDLQFARTRCRHALNNRRFWSPRYDLRLDGWERYRETVSQQLADAQWHDVASAVAAMRGVQTKCDALRTRYGERPELGKISVRLINEYIESSKGALDALRALSGDRPTDEVVDLEDAA